ncbi:putative ABC transport system permease protein [Dyadobacter koreensis]|uniref:Putative ABC transport system permease protein n=1 Tax=Dyadobacter koreensis TaxID=408657 RepID=A0A1H6Q4L8_9BACT|nr:ABC transporter permease [Dyadobacter koreensis]SEI38761.1 putative ABC transport system permease protein [Dyadobacter koreensis]
MSFKNYSRQEIPQPPKWLDRFARWICAPHLRETLIGDLHERYALRVCRFGAKKASALYRREVVGLIRPSIIKRQKLSQSPQLFFNFIMLGNYFKIGSRVLIKNKGYSFIHLVGLTIGLWACMMVATVVIDSLSYDKQWARSNDLYRIVTIDKRGEGMYERGSYSNSSLAAELKKNYPEVENYSSISQGTSYLNLTKGEMNGVKTNVLRMDTTAWQMLDVKVLSGNPSLYQAGNKNIVISETFRNKFFINQDPVGKIIYDTPSYGDKANPYLITGVMEDLPYNSHLRADVIQVQQNRVLTFSTDGASEFSQNYLLMKRGTDMNKFQARVNSWYSRVMKDDRDQTFEFQPMQDIYLNSDFAQNQKIKGSARTIHIFAGVALLLLFIACVNFVNLSTARAFSRLKETGIRRILSGSRYQLMMQILAETFLLFGISFSAAILVYYFSLKSVESFLGHKLVQTFTSNPSLAASAIGVIFLTCLFTGFYPAWMISGLKPTDTIRGVISTSISRQNWLRKGLVITQFTISIVVLFATIVVRQQLSYMENKNLGYNKNNLLTIGGVSWEGKSEAFKNEVNQIPGVVSSSISQWLPTGGAGFMSQDVEDPANQKNKVKVWYIAGDIDLPRTLGLRLVRGRTFDLKYGADVLNADSLREVNWKKYEEEQSRQSSLLTESAAKILHIKELGIQIKNASTVPIGVIENFNNESLYETIKPTVIIAQRSAQYGSMLIRTKPGMETNVNASLKKLWKKFFAAKLLEINSVEDLLTKQYEAESKLQQLFVFFSTLTMFLSALGIFGLVVQAAEQREKEVGIRKVLGASVAEIVTLLSSDFVKLVSFSFFVASPIAWYSLGKWLQSYPYRIGIDWWMFLIAGFGAILTTLITVSFQTIKAAMMDPVKNLRNE